MLTQSMWLEVELCRARQAGADCGVCKKPSSLVVVPGEHHGQALAEGHSTATTAVSLYFAPEG